MSNVSPLRQVMVFHCIATVLYLTAFLANAATVHYFTYYLRKGHLGAAAVRRLTPPPQTHTRIKN